MHEQSETVERDGKFFNVYGVNTPSAGKVLPGEPAYNTLKEAVTAAKNRSEQYGHTHNPEGNKMADEPKMTAEMKRQVEDARQVDASKKAYDKVSPLGKGIPSIPVEKKATGGKVQKVMQEFKSGSLKSSSGQKVTDPKQAIAIGLSEQRKMKGGGSVNESKKMMGKEVAFMQKKGAPASMMKHEKAEMGMKGGGMPMKDGKPAFMKKFAKGGGIESHGKTKGTMIRMATGGSVSARADGIAQRGKTKFKNF